MHALSCSFCGKDKKHTKHLVSGPSVYICDECVQLSVEIMRDNDRAKSSSGRSSKAGGASRAHTPHTINQYLNERIIGQDRAKKILAVATYNHWKRLEQPELKLRKSNVLLVGPSGSGKTLLLQTLADLMGVPFHIADATSLTAAGYVGQDVESILSGLIRAADGDLNKAAKGIVFIDEFDKVRKQKTGDFGSKDVGGESVQQGILKMLEGSSVEVPEEGNNHPSKKRIVLETSNILFILGGAFVGLADKNPEVKTEDLINYGILPEVLGRVPVIAQLRDLTREEMRKVLTEVKNGPIDEYKKLFDSEDVKLEFSEGALDRIVDRAIEKKTGTRSLKAIIEDSLIDTMFDLPTLRGEILKCVVTAESIDKTEGPRLYKNEKSPRQQRRDRAKTKAVSAT